MSEQLKFRPADTPAPIIWVTTLATVLQDFLVALQPLTMILDVSKVWVFIARCQYEIYSLRGCYYRMLQTL
jgi:hypothetical protein